MKDITGMKSAIGMMLDEKTQLVNNIYNE